MTRLDCKYVRGCGRPSSLLWLQLEAGVGIVGTGRVLISKGLTFSLLEWTMDDIPPSKKWYKNVLTRFVNEPTQKIKPNSIQTSKCIITFGACHHTQTK